MSPRLAPRATRGTVLDHLVEQLRAKDLRFDGQERPMAVLWTDPQAEWRPLEKIKDGADASLARLFPRFGDGDHRAAARAQRAARCTRRPSGR